MRTTSKKTAPALVDSFQLTSGQFHEKLISLKTIYSADNSRHFKQIDKDNKFFGIPLSAIFALAKEFKEMPLNEVERLLQSDYYEARMGAVSIMDFQARDKKTSPVRRKELYDLYIKEHHRINNWDLVDRGAPYIIGGYLFDKSRIPLYKLAKSKNPWERRTAIVSTYFFIRQNDLEDTFKIAAVLVHDKHDLINKAVGSWVREAGKRDKGKLTNFLDKYAAAMPRVTLRYAIEQLDKKQKEMYSNLKDDANKKWQNYSKQRDNRYSIEPGSLNQLLNLCHFKMLVIILET